MTYDPENPTDEGFVAFCYKQAQAEGHNMTFEALLGWALHIWLGRPDALGKLPLYVLKNLNVNMGHVFPKDSITLKRFSDIYERIDMIVNEQMEHLYKKIYLNGELELDNKQKEMILVSLKRWCNQLEEQKNSLEELVELPPDDIVILGLIERKLHTLTQDILEVQTLLQGIYQQGTIFPEKQLG